MPRRRSRRNKRSRSRQRGGNYTSGASYGMYVNGTGPAQYDRTYSLSSPYSNSTTTYVGAQGENYIPRDAANVNLDLIQSAGRRGKKGKKGGVFIPVLNQAIVPATILAMQQTYGRRGNGSNKTRRHPRFRR